MTNLGINNNFIGWTQSLLTEKLGKLIIDRFANPCQKVETTISQSLPLSPILFLIYISKVFLAIKAKLPNNTYVSCVNDLVFVTSDCSINKVRKALEEKGKIALQ